MMLVLAVLTLAAAEPPAGQPTADDTASSLAGLQQMYDQSCAAREYGAYDDLCDQLSQQMKAARRDADREARRQAADARRRPRSAATQPPQSAAAQPSPATAVSPPQSPR